MVLKLAKKNKMTANNRDHIISAANTLRWELGENFHDEIMESIYKEAGKISRKTVVVTGEQQGFNLDRKIDKIVTSPVWGFPIMFLLLAVVFWLTISGPMCLPPCYLLYWWIRYILC